MAKIFFRNLQGLCLCRLMPNPVNTFFFCLILRKQKTRDLYASFAQTTVSTPKRIESPAVSIPFRVMDSCVSE